MLYANTLKGERKSLCFRAVRFDAVLLQHLSTLGGFTPDTKPSPVIISEVIRRSEIQVDSDRLERYRPDPAAKLDKVFEQQGKAFAYYYLDCPRGKEVARHWWRYKVDAGKPVIDAVFPVAFRNAH